MDAACQPQIKVVELELRRIGQNLIELGIRNLLRLRLVYISSRKRERKGKQYYLNEVLIKKSSKNYLEISLLHFLK